MDTMLWVCAGITLASAILALIFLPHQAFTAYAEPVAPSGETGAERAQLEV
jgi:hypothetical protein